MSIRYKDNDKMSDVICDEPALLQMMTRFGIPLGVGDKSVKEICENNNIDTDTVLAVANYTKQGKEVAEYYAQQISVKALIVYLSRAHAFFLNFQLPAIRRKLLEAIDCSRENEVAFLILKFYDEYMLEVRKHMQHENRKIFTYVNNLIAGTRQEGFEIAMFAKSHEAIDRKLQELKNIIIKYYTRTDGYELLAGVLFDIFNCEADLRVHCALEDDLFIPAVQRLEKEVSEHGVSGDTNETDDKKTTVEETLSDREKEIVRCVVCGLTNKEVADKLYISVNTVLTHRKNISRKLNIHSVSGLTIYAIVNKLVSLNDVKMP
jgi:regulator of cell morphogenesis and NO signaling